MTNWQITSLLPTWENRVAITCLRCRWHTVELCPTQESLRAILDAHDAARHP